ncbi:uncharacterized protein LOC62_03G003764 [Vanrija pseudolonga]|uniref:Peroxin-14 n=1 Tax=Vanrija pseudolonga TaxID=143232 RepID=A0AAF0Y4P4_9TREE|nr:hypothetical protein LOC62_03G003764 [Vanrija pseudolonga]
MSDNNDPPAPPPASAATPAPPPPETAAPASSTGADAGSSTSPDGASSAAADTPTPSPSSSSIVPTATASASAAGAATQIYTTAHEKAARYGMAPKVKHLPVAPTPARAPSSLPLLLKRLAYLVGIVLGGGALVAGLWSTFLLPLLHATYSARTALSIPQKERWRSLLDSLGKIRALGIYRRPRESGEDDKEKVPAGNELALVRTRSSQKSDGSNKDKDGTKPPPSVTAVTVTSEDEDTRTPPSLHADPSALSASLRDLAASLDATNTTRTSLISTLESYTSGLHRELFVARGLSNSTWGGGSAYGGTGRVGLGTLSANLAQASNPNGGAAGAASGTDSVLGLPAAKSQEWDAVRREVRAIKGLLLNRRNFAVPAAGGR